MDAPTLDDALAGISVLPPDDLGAKPQFAQIRAAQTFFFTTMSNDPMVRDAVYQGLAPALQEPVSIDGLCAIVDSVVGGGVSTKSTNPLAASTNFTGYFDVDVLHGDADNFGLQAMPTKANDRLLPIQSPFSRAASPRINRRIGRRAGLAGIDAVDSNADRPAQQRLRNGDRRSGGRAACSKRIGW